MSMMATEQRNPRVWIGCLAAYNAGHLHGEWVDVPDDADELYEEIKRVLAASPEPGAEEWGFFDTEDFHPWRPSEYQGVASIVAAARLIREHGEAAAIWLDNDDSPISGERVGEQWVDADYDDVEERFTEQYAGEWENDEAYARNFVEGCGLPGVGFVWPESRDDFGGYIARGDREWSDVLDELDGILDWDAIYSRVAEGDVWSKDGHYFRSDG